MDSDSENITSLLVISPPPPHPPSAMLIWEVQIARKTVDKPENNIELEGGGGGG